MDTNRNSTKTRRVTKVKQTHQPPKFETFNIEGFKLIKPRLQTTSPQKQHSTDDWQHPLSPKPIKITVFDHNTNKNDSNTTDIQTTTPDNLTEDIYDLLKDAPDNYILRQTFEPEIEQEIQNQHPNSSQFQETQSDYPNKQSTSTTQTDKKITSELTKSLFCVSPGKQALRDNDVFNHLTTDEGNNIMYLNLSTNLALKKNRHMYYFPMDFGKLTLDGLINTGALRSAISEADPYKVKLL